MSETTTQNNTMKVVIGALVALVLCYLALRYMSDWSGGSAGITSILVGVIVAILLWIGWRPKEVPVVPEMRDADSEPLAAAPKAAPVAEAATTAAVTHAPAADGRSAIPAVAPKAKAAPVADSPAPAAAPKPKAAPTRKAEAKPAAKTAAKPVAADGKPELLSAPRGGAGDDLKQIKGVGPKLQSLLNEMGVWHFDQIAGWRKKEVAWVDNALTGVNKGRVSRDDWVSQAKLLAKGGETEFSKRVKKGDVY